MNAKQLELFTESDFEQQKTYFRTLNGWFIVDKINNQIDNYIIDK